MQNIVLLIDINNIFAKFYFAGKSNPNSAITSTKCADLIVSYIFDLVSFFKATHCCCVFDSVGPTFRYTIYPDYKKTRKPKPDDYDAYRNVLKTVLRGAGIAQISSKSLEAEDSINLIIGQYAGDPSTDFIIISDDKDCQLLRIYPNCKIYKKTQNDRDIPLKGPPAVISNIPSYCKILENDPNFIDKYKLFFSLYGDSADNIPGVPKFGEIKSNFIVSKFNSYFDLKNFILSDTLELDALTLYSPDNKFNIVKCLQSIKECENLLDISYKLFSLYEIPRDGPTFNVDIENWKF